jgi:hypothetical protein
MASPTIKLWFNDGQTAEAKLNPRALIESERKFGDKLQSHAAEGQFFAAWCRLGRPGDFDAWLDTIEDWEEVSEPADPSQPAPSGDS